ncbi:glycoside hydrolase family 55 protein [Zasmidium cellare ATCC 36951]|uniref:Glycoside hydrolase family 55 protein n=1 Tax=Zasmidium cellare ATCC 36951 TaxID=1080233 RepID=A0A6A6D1H9_ZASCE|nr:glycoside hydrolase family 55 protein [Zasmidium cellare ATCC 36951]KAF2172022.1 glycoside hydrolase family 55 protein [Zasmidium cellare ATCC 36951]
MRAYAFAALLSSITCVYGTPVPAEGPVNNQAQASCGGPVASNPSTFWYEHITHDGTSPFINDNNWVVFRNVVSYRADSSGNSDSQSAIQNAINDGSNSGYSRTTNSLGTTGQPAVVYLPAGTYTIESPLQLYVGTVLMGDPVGGTTIKAGSSFNSNTLIYGKDSNQDSTTNFYIKVEHLTLDSNNINKDTTFTLLDWSVSQATQLSDVVFNMPNYSTRHTGIAMPEGGSGTFMGNLQFNGGFVGLNMDNQQYEGKSLTFNGCTTGILVSHCYDCVFIDINFMNAEYGLDVSGGNIGFVALLDSTASNINTAVRAAAPSTGDHSLVIENFVQGNSVANVVTANGNPVLNNNVQGQAWVWGNAYVPNGPNYGSHQEGTLYNSPRPSVLTPSNGDYLVIEPPSYKEYDLDQFINVKQVSGYPVYGDGNTDDTNNLNAIISMYAGCKILFFPSGTYIVTNTIFFPAGSRVVGEAWAAISAVGSNYYNPQSPNVMVQVGNPGDKGVAQFSGLLFTVADVLQGCTLLEVNIAGNSPGDVAFWDCHFRVGGAAGSKVQTNCGGNPDQCKAAFLLAHLTSSSSAYLENIWGWTADHDLDSGNGQTISTGRGILVEATAGTWLHGTAFEHNTLYQYSFQNAQNVFAGMQQSETPYWQGNGSPSLDPAPWSSITGSPYYDPDFSNCDGGDAQCRMAWFTYINGGSNLFLYGAGFWTFFNDGQKDCQNSGVCQTNAVWTNDVSNLYWYGINEHLNLNLVVNNGQVLVTQNNNPGSWGGVVAAYLTDS